ncbi:MAG: 50S ribosomal protein L1 [Armatimonadota bacterium]
MPQHGKRCLEAKQKVDRNRLYSVREALELAKSLANARFDETIDIAVNLGVDPRHGDQMVRGTTTLPHGTGKKVKVAVFAKGEKVEEALNAGADVVGAEDLIQQIQQGWRDFDVLVATPDMVPQVSRLGRLLGPRMPNAKSGTVTNDLDRVVRDLKLSKRVAFRVEKAGIVHMPIGKASFEVDHLLENFNTAVNALLKAKPAAAKGRYLRGITVSSTMGPGIRVDTQEAQKLAETAA